MRTSKKIIFVLMAMLLVFNFTACGSSSSEDRLRENLESGRLKEATGQPMTKEEYNAVKGFNEWKEKQGTKTYDEWDD